MFFLSRSQLKESNKTSFIIFGAIHEFLHILQDCRNINPKKTLAKSLGVPESGHTHQPEADRWVPRPSAPPRPGQGRPGLDRGVGAATTRVARHARAHVARGDGGGGAAQGGAARRGQKEAGGASTARRG